MRSASVLRLNLLAVDQNRSDSQHDGSRNNANDDQGDGPAGQMRRAASVGRAARRLVESKLSRGQAHARGAVLPGAGVVVGLAEVVARVGIVALSTEEWDLDDAWFLFIYLFIFKVI